MCNATKRKIADCVKSLMEHKEIRKITIQDIMNETHMSRQSFYYHFRDIYDVIEWIGEFDFDKVLEEKEYTNLDEWFNELLIIVNGNRTFLERMVNEMDWPCIVTYIKKPIEKQVINMMDKGGKADILADSDEKKFCVDFFATSYSYYLLDYINKKRNVTNAVVLEELKIVMRLLEGGRMDGGNKILSISSLSKKNERSSYNKTLLSKDRLQFSR